jgi:hypothetical protein
LLLPATALYTEKTSAPSTFFNKFTTLNDKSTSRTPGSDINTGTTLPLAAIPQTPSPAHTSEAPGSLFVVHKQPDASIDVYSSSTAPGSPVTLVPAVLEQGSVLVSSGLDKSNTPQAPSITCQSHHNNIPNPDACESHNITYPAAAQQSSVSPLNFHSRYAQVLHIITPMFGSILSVAKIILIIQTGDKLICDDAITFLRDQLPLWKGIWDQSNLLMPSSNDSLIDRFVKVSRYISILEERSIMDRVHILFYRVLQYQYYLRALEEVKQKPKDASMKRKRGIGDATYALDHLLKHLYIYDWDVIGSAEKQARRNCPYKQKYVGKQLHTLSCCIGFGILLLVSLEAIARMKVAPF